MNDLGWRGLRTVEARRSRMRDVIVIVLGIVVSSLFWLLWTWLILANTGPHL